MRYGIRYTKNRSAYIVWFVAILVSGVVGGIGVPLRLVVRPFSASIFSPKM